MDKEVLFMVEHCLSFSGLMKELCESFHKVGGCQSLFIQCLDGTRSSYLGFTFKFHVLMEIKECSSKG